MVGVVWWLDGQAYTEGRGIANRLCLSSVQLMAVLFSHHAW